MCDIVVKKFTFTISSPDEFLLLLFHTMSCLLLCTGFLPVMIPVFYLILFSNCKQQQIYRVFISSQTIATATVGGMVVQWVEHWTCDQQVVGSNPTRGKQKLCNNLGQVVHTYVPLSPSGVTWYLPRSRDVLRLGR